MEHHIDWKVGEEPGSNKEIRMTIWNSGAVSLTVVDENRRQSEVSMPMNIAKRVIKNYAEILEDYK